MDFAFKLDRQCFKHFHLSIDLHGQFVRFRSISPRFDSVNVFLYIYVYDFELFSLMRPETHKISYLISGNLFYIPNATFCSSLNNINRKIQLMQQWKSKCIRLRQVKYNKMPYKVTVYTKIIIICKIIGVQIDKSTEFLIFCLFTF